MATYCRRGRRRGCDLDHPALADVRSRLIKDFENYLVFYRATESGIDVLRVLRGARDIDSILKDEESG